MRPQASQLALRAIEAGVPSAAFVVAALSAQNTRNQAVGEAKTREVLKAAPADDPFIVYCWLLLEEIETTPESAQNAFASLQKLADNGDCFAQFCIGALRRDGRAVNKDERAAVEQFRKAAEQGHALAQLALAVMLEHGQGAARNCTLAAQWYRKAAEQGEAVAQFNLAFMLEHSEGAENAEEAAKWYRKAAEQGVEEAQRRLAELLEQGELTTKDEKQAAHWYHKAAEQGNEAAARKLARLRSGLCNLGCLRSRTVSSTIAFGSAADGTGGQRTNDNHICPKRRSQAPIFCGRSAR